MGATAAWLYGIGEVSPSPYEFCTPERKQTKRVFRQEDLSKKSIGN